MEKRFLKHIFIQFVCLVLFSSCYNYRNTGLLQEDRVSLPEYKTGQYDDYRIRINDELIFRVLTSDKIYSSIYGSSNAASSNLISYRVAADGSINLPFIHNVEIVGMTIDEATELIEDCFKEIIPDATIKLALSTKSFTVIGEVGTGIFPVYKERLNIYQALALAGNLQQAGDRQHVKIIRETDEGTKVLEFDVRPQSVIESEYYYVYPNDIIYVRRLPSSFYKVGDYSGFIGLINTTITFFSTVLIYIQIK